jgi:hypothetical protein
VYNVLARLFRRVLGSARGSTKDEREAVCSEDAQMQIAVDQHGMPREFTSQLPSNQLRSFVGIAVKVSPSARQGNRVNEQVTSGESAESVVIL